MSSGTKGLRSTEFWVTIIVIVAGLVASIADELPPRYAAIVAAVASGLYAVSRGLAKNESSPPLPPVSKKK